MKNILFFSLLCCANLAAAFNPTNAKQLLLVITAKEEAITGYLQRYQRNNIHHSWESVGDPIAVVVGAKGLAPVDLKKEGDGKTPVGVYTLSTAFGFSDKPLTDMKLPYLALKDSHVCVDDVESMHYNQIVNKTHGMTDWRSGEPMADIPLYKLGAVMNYNAERQPSKGSCIFMHIWRDPTLGTAGCIAMAEENLQEVLTWVDPKKRPIIAIFTLKDYVKYQHQFSLPKLSSIR